MAVMLMNSKFKFISCLLVEICPGASGSRGAHNRRFLSYDCTFEMLSSGTPESCITPSHNDKEAFLCSLLCGCETMR